MTLATSSKLIPKKKKSVKISSLPSGGSQAPAGGQKKKRPRRKGGKKAKQRQKKRQLKKWFSKIWAKRAEDRRNRGSKFAIGKVTPLVLLSWGKLAEKHTDMSQGAFDFYCAHEGGNRVLRLSRDGEANVSNPTGKKGGGRGVFARKEITRGTILCPYAGEVHGRACLASVGCQYDLMIDKSTYLCAGKVLFDIGYHMMDDMYNPRNAGVKHVAPSEPNYGRYFNTLLAVNGERPEEEDFNVFFEVCSHGHDIVYARARCNIPKGTELLVDYGALYDLVVPTPDVDEGYGTGCDSEDEDFV